MVQLLVSGQLLLVNMKTFYFSTLRLHKLVSLWFNNKGSGLGWWRWLGSTTSWWVLSCSVLLHFWPGSRLCRSSRRECSLIKPLVEVSISHVLSVVRESTSLPTRIETQLAWYGTWCVRECALCVFACQLCEAFHITVFVASLIMNGCKIR